VPEGRSGPHGHGQQGHGPIPHHGARDIPKFRSTYHPSGKQNRPPLAFPWLPAKSSEDEFGLRVACLCHSTGACRPDWSHPWSPLLGHVRRQCLCRCQRHLKLPSIAAPMLRGEPQLEMHTVLRRHWVGLSPKTFAAEWQGWRLGLRSPFHIPLRTMNHRHIAEPHCPGRPIHRVSTQGWSRRRHLPG